MVLVEFMINYNVVEGSRKVIFRVFNHDKFYVIRSRGRSKYFIKMWSLW